MIDVICVYLNTFSDFSMFLQNATSNATLNRFFNAQTVIALATLFIQGYLTYMIYSVNNELKELETEEHIPQFEVSRYQYYPRDGKDSFEVEISNFGQGSVRNLKGVAKALPEDSEQFDPKSVEIPLERSKAVGSDWNAVRANGVAPNEHDVGFVCEASLKFGNLDGEDETNGGSNEPNTYHFQQAVADLSKKDIENIHFKYWLKFDNKYCDEEETKHKVIDLIFPAKEDWTLEKVINEGWDYENYKSDKEGYRMAVL